MTVFPHLFASQLSTGSYHSCGLTTDDHLLCWGANNTAQLGTGLDPEVALSPIEVTGPDFPLLAAVAGGRHTCVLSQSGQVWCWGRNVYGQLGLGTQSELELDPTAIAATAIPSMDQLTAGEEFTCGLDSDQLIHCWGDNADGQLGDATVSPRALPGLIQEP